MGSVFMQLLDTLPFHLASEQLTSGGQRSFGSITARDAAQHLKFLPRTGVFKRVLPPPTSTPHPHPWSPVQDNISRHHDVPLWAWRTPTLTSLDNVQCRTFDSGNAAYQVFDEVAFGTVSQGDHPFASAVTFQLLEGETFQAPLTERFVHSRWFLRNGMSRENRHRMWPLEQKQDSALVVVFAYEIVAPFSFGTLEALAPFTFDREPVSRDAAGELEVESAAPDWGGRIIEGDFMSEPDHNARTSKAGEPRLKGRVITPRILVALCFSVHKTREDFDPGGVASMARVFAQIFTKCNVPLRSVDAAIHFSRPSTTTRTDEGNQNAAPLHDGHHDEHSAGKMSPLFVTDANSLASTPADAPFPVWSELFAYYSDDVGEILTWGSLEVVRSRDWSKKDREIDRYGRRIPFFPFVDQVKLSKTPGQGEFDSLHLAPSLKYILFQTA